MTAWPFLLVAFIAIAVAVRALRRWHEANELIAMYERAQVREAARNYRTAVKEERGW